MKDEFYRKVRRRNPEGTWRENLVTAGGCLGSIVIVLVIVAAALAAIAAPFAFAAFVIVWTLRAMGVGI